jgi:hypothetical protein
MERASNNNIIITSKTTGVIHLAALQVGASSQAQNPDRAIWFRIFTL